MRLWDLSGRPHPVERLSCTSCGCTCYVTASGNLIWEPAERREKGCKNPKCGCHVDPLRGETDVDLSRQEKDPRLKETGVCSSCNSVVLLMAAVCHYCGGKQLERLTVLVCPQCNTRNRVRATAKVQRCGRCQYDLASVAEERREAHKVLGLSPGCSSQEIESAYRRLAQIYHPDRYRTAPEGVRIEAEGLMRRLNDARSKLRQA